MDRRSEFDHKIKAFNYFCRMFFKRKYKYFLSVICIFKNESASIVEWIEHNLAEGVEHFHMIDNGSIDDTIEKLQPYLMKI